MNCCPVCPREQESRDCASPGPVQDHEIIVRGAFHPRHGNKNTGSVKNGILSRKDLKNGNLSVWRVSQLGLTDFDAVEATLQKLDPENSSPFALAGPTAKQIRDLSISDQGQRVFCVLDECDCDQNGNKHPAHAHIAICEKLQSILTKEDPTEFTELFDLLVTLFKSEITTIDLK